MDLQSIGHFVVPEPNRKKLLADFKKAFDIEELMYLATCNRVEFIGLSKNKLPKLHTQSFFNFWKDRLGFDQNFDADKIEVHSGLNVPKHLFALASSLESVVIGEREIITQVRKAHEESVKMKLSGDRIRVLMRKTIETAKEVYSKTEIARHPVSISSLAFRELKNHDITKKNRVIVIGSGETNSAVARFVHKHGNFNFSVFNRTVENGEKLAKELNGKSYPLSALKDFNEGFDVLISCTGSDEVMVTPAIYEQLLGQEKDKKILVDLAIPYDIDREIHPQHNCKLIDIDTLKILSKTNEDKRRLELGKCWSIISTHLDAWIDIFHDREIELAMQQVPKKVKEIKTLAMTEVFAKEISGLDSNSKEVLENVLNYFEKKYISVPMKMAKEIIGSERKTKSNAP